MVICMVALWESAIRFAGLHAGLVCHGCATFGIALSQFDCSPQHISDVTTIPEKTTSVPGTRSTLFSFCP